MTSLDHTKLFTSDGKKPTKATYHSPVAFSYLLYLCEQTKWGPFREDTLYNLETAMTTASCVGCQGPCFNAFLDSFR